MTTTRQTLAAIAVMDIFRATLRKVEVQDTVDATLTLLVNALRFDPQVYEAQQALQAWIDTIPHDISDRIPEADHFIGKD